MNIYLMKSNQNSYDEYDSMLIIAESSKEAKEISDGYFEESQKTRCQFIGTSKRKIKGILMVSYNSGYR